MAWRINHPEDHERLVSIATYTSQTEFLLARTRLESAGIECFARNEHASRIAGHLGALFAAHQIDLQVRESDAEDAIAVLEAEFAVEEDDEPEQWP